MLLMWIIQYVIFIRPLNLVPGGAILNPHSWLFPGLNATEYYLRHLHKLLNCPVGEQEKLLVWFLPKPTDFKYDELRRLLIGFGYEELKAGRTSGSRIAFANRQNEDYSSQRDCTKHYGA